MGKLKRQHDHILGYIQLVQWVHLPHTAFHTPKLEHRYFEPAISAINWTLKHIICQHSRKAPPEVQFRYMNLLSWSLANSHCLESPVPTDHVSKPLLWLWLINFIFMLYSSYFANSGFTGALLVSSEDEESSFATATCSSGRPACRTSS